MSPDNWAQLLTKFVSQSYNTAGIMWDFFRRGSTVFVAANKKKRFKKSRVLQDAPIMLRCPHVSYLVLAALMLATLTI